MKNLFAAALCAVLLGLSSATYALAPVVPLTDLTPQAEHRRATRLITHFITNYHYKKAPLDDQLSQTIFDNYLTALDPTKSYFTQSDIDEFSAFSHELDDDLRNSDLQTLFDMFVRFRQRVTARMTKTLASLATPIDFTLNETFEFQREDAAWAKTRPSSTNSGASVSKMMCWRSSWRDANPKKLLRPSANAIKASSGKPPSTTPRMCSKPLSMLTPRQSIPTVPIFRPVPPRISKFG